ncbi:MAG TPA: shikimate kinase [Bryobacteraceae bacterium]|nr:shikimate kinase [Bryobacteraceae bacterium]
MILKLKRTPGIYLAGFMGSGKSTIGLALAEELGWSFLDLDAEIERREGAAISEIFDTRGEADFRRVESETLCCCVRSVQSGKPQVVSLGGGAFLTEVNYDLVSNNGVSVWLDCPLPMIEKRIAAHTHRPLARDPEKLRQLFEERRSGYQRADYRIEIVSDDAGEAVARILALPLF